MRTTAEQNTELLSNDLSLDGVRFANEVCSADEERPLLSIGMTVYNQEKYIARAIESILMQRVNFKYEIVIAEDCSTDRSREIVIEYAKRYPEVIRLILQEHNVGLREQSICLKKACRGIYRAHLEGDDYWVAYDKLQKQIDFLETHPDYVGVSGQIYCVDDNNKKCAFPYGALTSIYCFEGDYTIDHFQQWLLPSHTGALLYRNIFYQCGSEFLDAYESYDVMGDRKTALLLLAKGKVYVMPEEVSIRRISLNSAANFTGNSIKMKPYAKIVKWMIILEEMASELFGLTISLKEEKYKQWIYSLKNLGRFPTKLNLKTVKAVYNLSKEKRRYRKAAMDLLKGKAKRKIGNEGLLKAGWGIVKMGLKTVKKLFKSGRDSEQEKVAMKIFDSQSIKK